MSKAAAADEPSDIMGGMTFQERVREWVVLAFGEDVANDVRERNFRFLEEALELVQSYGATADEAHRLVDYVFGRPQGDAMQEIGGVLVTLAALCAAHADSMSQCAHTELGRCYLNIDKIRRKQAAKARDIRGGPLPGEVTT